jgi:hypothetical protein
MQAASTVAVSSPTATTTTQHIADEEGISLSQYQFLLTQATYLYFSLCFALLKDVDEQLDMTSYKPNRKVHFTPNEDHSLLRQYVALRVQDLSRSTIDWSKIGMISLLNSSLYSEEFDNFFVDIPGKSSRDCLARFNYLIKQTPYRRAVQVSSLSLLRVSEMISNQFCCFITHL